MIVCNKCGTQSTDETRMSFRMMTYNPTGVVFDLCKKCEKELADLCDKHTQEFFGVSLTPPPATKENE